MLAIVAPDPWQAFLEAQNFQPCVATIGNFDGVHLGHQALLSGVVRRARALGLPSLVLTFEPHPSKILRQGFAELQNTVQRLDHMRDLGIDQVLLLPFSRDFAAGLAADFFHLLLHKRLAVKELLLGHDFRMGKDQAGAGEIAAYGSSAGVVVRQIAAVLQAGQPVSSSRIRAALRAGELDEANAMLGHLHAIRGQVEHGAGRGGPQLGFPTANIALSDVVLPQPAVYATYARLSSVPAPALPAGQTVRWNDWGGFSPPARPHPAMTSFGKNPTFGGNTLSLETYLLDFSQDIYGKDLEIAFWKKMRDEQKFADVADLKRQLRADEVNRRKLAAG